MMRCNKPDYGETFVPGSESAPQDQAPQAMDHFKRGYEERNKYRNRGKLEFPSDGLSTHDAKSRRTAVEKHSTTQQATSHVDPVLDKVIQRMVEDPSKIHHILTDESYRQQEKFGTGITYTYILNSLCRMNRYTEVMKVWAWMEDNRIKQNVHQFNILLGACEKMKDWKRAMDYLSQMERKNVQKNAMTFTGAISACEKCGNYEMALKLLDQMKDEGLARTTVAYNSAISACEKALKPLVAMDLFQRMKADGCVPSAITYSALISACEKGGQWKLSIEYLNEMKQVGFGINLIAYSAAISACARGQQWENALQLFREIEENGTDLSVITCNALMSALEKGLQWEKALDLFDDMKYKNMPVTVVSYGSAISACDKGCQWQQCLSFLDEMTDKGIKKNVIIFGAAMSCMEKSCRADISFKLMDAMYAEGLTPNAHIYNSVISTCARCSLWEKGYDLFLEMDRKGIARDVVTYNAVLDAVCNNVPLGRKIFQEGIEKGFYARVSRLGESWLELDLHFLSFGGGEIALWWWFEVCLVPYLVTKSKLNSVQSISIVTGMGKTRWRGARLGNDSMHKRVSEMLRCMKIREVVQGNRGRINIDRDAFILEVERNGGKILFDTERYQRFKDEETSSNKVPITEQHVRPREGSPRPDDFYAAAAVCQENIKPTETDETIGNQRSQIKNRYVGLKVHNESKNLDVPCNHQESCKASRYLPSEKRNQGKHYEEDSDGKHRNKLDMYKNQNHLDRNNHSCGVYGNSTSYIAPIDSKEYRDARDIPVGGRKGYHYKGSIDSGEYRSKYLDKSEHKQWHDDDQHHKYTRRDKENEDRKTSYESRQYLRGGDDIRGRVSNSPSSRDSIQSYHNREDERRNYSCVRVESKRTYSSRTEESAYDSDRRVIRDSHGPDDRNNYKSHRSRKRSPSQSRNEEFTCDKRLSNKRVRQEASSSNGFHKRTHRR